MPVVELEDGRLLTRDLEEFEGGATEVKVGLQLVIGPSVDSSTPEDVAFVPVCRADEVGGDSSNLAPALSNIEVLRLKRGWDGVRGSISDCLSISDRSN